MIEFLAGLVSGAVAGAYARKGYVNHKVAKVVVLPPFTAELGVYVVKLDGRLVYTGNDAQEAKRIYKSQDLPGKYMEFYTNGNHVQTRKLS